MKDASGSHLASFDIEGNFVLEGNGLGQDSVDSGVITAEKLAEELEASSSYSEFLIRDGSGITLARLTREEDALWDSNDDGDRDDDSDGIVDEMMFIRGRLYENVAVDMDSSITCPCFRVKNAAGDTVALINSEQFTNSSVEPDSPYAVVAGSLLLKGRALIGVNPDRIQSQGR